jgi:hypothetical protein
VTLRPGVALTVTERDFQRTVIELAHLFGWKVAHFRTAMNARGVYMTPVGADGAGWPDLVLIHPARGRILYRELKAERGRLDPRQTTWGEWLTAAGCDWTVWRPSDMPEITYTLSHGTAHTTETTT